MSASVEEIAERFRVAAEEGPRELNALLAELYADPVTALHEPPNDHDGPIGREKLVHLSGLEQDLFHRVINNYRYEDAKFVVDGDDHIEFAWTMLGTLEDGSELVVHNKGTFTIADGQLTGFLSKGDPSEAGKLMEIVAASGIIQPEVAS